MPGVKATPLTVRVTDDVRVPAVEHVPAAPARAGVVLAHPHPLHGGDKENVVVRALADACAARGLLALRFDFRHARSRVGGDALFADSDADLAAAVAATRARLPDDALVAVAGYSFGALTLLRAWRALDAAALVCVGLPVNGALRDVVEWPALVDDARPPLLVLQGQYDEVGTPADVHALFATHDVAAEVRTIPNASHGYFGETELVARTAAGFVAKRVA